jgi:hypothetical protein
MYKWDDQMPPQVTFFQTKVVPLLGSEATKMGVGTFNICMSVVEVVGMS